MESRDEKLIAIIGLLSACLIGVVFLFLVTRLTDVRHPAGPSRDVQRCTAKKTPVHPT
ncbi:hypothetical protein [Candidatus Pantoea persica]|uniref:hypothetical protein n=1 Tax=Candidatus Pantoea persica TaxID=2518128 RepID=UPI00215DA73A|nr:hypothetical protein [Candidatus Pantoea persica]MBA2814872.1 hypothetical protein [Candidatus Pantoea persica]